MRADRILGALALAGPITITPAAAQQRGAYVATIGQDTVAVDRFSRQGGRLDGQLILRSPSTRVIEYHLTFDADGTPARLEYVMTSPDGAPLIPHQSGVITFGADTVDMAATRGDSTRTSQATVRRGAVPLLSVFYSYGLLAEAIRQSLRARGDSLPFRIYLPGSRGSLDTWLRRDGGDTVRVAYAFGATLRALVGSDGTIREINTLESTVRAVGRLAPWERTQNLAAAWSAQDKAGKGLGPLSPRDTTRATVGAAAITIDYSRPHTRGRVILGKLVPFGEVWRAGADAATQFECSTDLTLGAQHLAAGKYTLWILPRDSTGAQLLVNSQTGQWGTDHDSARDILHLPLQVETVASPVDEFTIAVEHSDQQARLTFSWDRTRWSIPLDAAP
jgi:Protein of unknown function (DUF2911)